MKPEIVEKINREIFTQFPYLKGCDPQISSTEENNFRLIYKASAKTENGFPISLIVRVVANSEGKIIKLSTSR